MGTGDGRQSLTEGMTVLGKVNKRVSVNMVTLFWVAKGIQERS